MSSPSDNAVAKGYNNSHRTDDGNNGTAVSWNGAKAVAEGIHDPALGLDRSVCLRDVVEALGRVPYETPPTTAAAFIEHEFGGAE